MLKSAASEVMRVGRARALALGVAVSAAIVLGSILPVAVQPAEAAFPGKDGKIAFARSFRIWEKKPTLNAPETKFRDDGASDSQAAYSPDGSRVAFVRNSPGPEIYVANANGTGTPSRLTNNTVVDTNPVWSHDGTRIAFVRGNQVWTMSASGTGQTQRTSDGVNTDPAWSVPLLAPDAPDGKIVYRHNFAELWTMNPNGSGKAELGFECPTDNGVCDTSIGIPTFSPDGTKVAFDYSGDIYWTFTAGGGNSTPILRGGTNRDQEYPGDEKMAAWSPNGARIAFLHNGNVPGSQYAIYTASASGSSTQATQVTSVGVGDNGNFDWQPNSAPTITSVRPSAGTDIRDRTPATAATVSDKQTNLAKANITLSLDGNAIPRTVFSYATATDRLSYTPARGLSFGSHTVQIVVRDEMGLEATHSWSFKIVR